MCIYKQVGKYNRKRKRAMEHIDAFRIRRSEMSKFKKIRLKFPDNLQLLCYGLLEGKEGEVFCFEKY